MTDYIEGIKIVAATILFQGFVGTTKDSGDAALDFFTRGYAYLRLGDYKSALKDFDRAIELNPNYLEAYIHRSTILSRTKKYEEAISDCLKAIEIDTKAAQAYLNLGLAYEKTGQDQKAKQCLIKAAKLGDKMANVYLRELRKQRRK